MTSFWRRKWQPTPVFLPGESQGRGGLVGCHLWGRTGSDTTEVTRSSSSMTSFIHLLFPVYPGYEYPFRSVHVLIPDFSLSNDCTVILVCINPMNKYRAFANDALIVIILV